VNAKAGFNFAGQLGLAAAVPGQRLDRPTLAKMLPHTSNPRLADAEQFRDLPGAEPLLVKLDDSFANPQSVLRHFASLLDPPEDNQ